MKRFLFTLCVTMLCAVGMWAQNQVTLSKETDGTIVVYFPQSGLWTPGNDNPTISSSSTATLDELKAATNVKVTGSISNNDIKEISYLIGTNSKTGKPARVLNMGEAQMTEALNLKGNDGQFPYQIANIETLTLPRPSATQTILPELYGWVVQWGNSNLKNLVISEGWTEISNSAFNNCNQIETIKFPNTLLTIGEEAFLNNFKLRRVDLGNCTNLEEIKKNAFACPYGSIQAGEQNETLLGIDGIVFPNNLKYIREGAFSKNRAKTLWMPENVQRIEANAFADWGGGNSLEDVFFTGHAPTYVDKNAFTASTQMANNTVADTGVNEKYMPSLDRSNYINNGYYACIMHYPPEYKAEYVDMTRDYYIVDTTEHPYKKGDRSSEYCPEGWTNDLKNQVNAKKDTDEWQIYNSTDWPWTDGGYLDNVLGMEQTWPSQAMMNNGYLIARSGYHWNGTEMSDAEKDKRGLYQFMLTAGDTPTPIIPGYEANLWYSISVPYDMSVQDIHDIFGNQTQVCRISQVLRDAPNYGPATEDDQEVGIWLYFQRSVMADGDGVGIQAYYPYMIKPAGDPVKQPVVDEETGELIRTFDNYRDKYKPGAMVKDVVTALTGNGSQISGLTQSEYTYTFVGSHIKTSLPQYTYFLGRKQHDPKQGIEGDHRFFFYTGTTAQGANRWKAHTAVVLPSDGIEDAVFLFGEPDPRNPQSSAHMVSFFGDEDVPSGVKEVDVEVNHKTTDNKVFSISGQYVGTSLDNLPKGIYVVNGKKHLVK